MRILVIASDQMEFPGIVAKADKSDPVNAGGCWARSVTIGGNELLLMANGAGAAHASAAVESGLRTFRADGIVSTGFCGAARRDLKIADIVLATTVIGHGREFRTAPARRAGLSGPVAYEGVVRTEDHVVQTAEEKAQLADEGVLAVEMEAAGVAGRAEAHGLPFWCIKAVTDLGGETLSNDYNRALREDGHFDTIVLLRGTLRSPLVRIRELLRLRERCVQAAGVLGDFFADLRF